MEFRDLTRQYQVLKSEIDKAIFEVINSANFISGKQVRELEEQLAEYVGVKHCISCGNGTDALTLALMAWDIGEGDAVFVPDFTFFSSGECPASVGAVPIFVDVERYTYNLDPDKLEKSILKIKEEGKYIPKAVIAVDLFGQAADYEKIVSVCNKYNLFLLEDGAQGFGGKIANRKNCSFGDISTTSFFPAKPLGCYGDGGAIFTDNDDWAKLIRSYAVHGKNSEDKYDNVRIGMNSRLDTIQAAILKIKLNAFSNYELEQVNKFAAFYTEKLNNGNAEIITPTIKETFFSSWAQYTIQLPDNVNRNDFQKHLAQYNIPTMIYYQKPMHKQTAFSNFSYCENEYCVTNYLSQHVVSLPIHPYMVQEEIHKVVEVIMEYCNLYSKFPK